MAHVEAHPRQPRKMPVIPRLAFVLVSLACALLLVGTGVAQAAMPGEPLYALKLSSEQAWRAANPHPVDVDLFIANRRANELLALANRPVATPNGGGVSKSSAEAEVLAAYTDVLNRLAAETTDIDASSILQELESHQSELSNAGIHVPRLDDIVSNGKSDKDHGQGQGNGNGNGSGNGNGNGNGQGNGHQP